MDELELAAALDGICRRSSHIIDDENAHNQAHKLLDRWGDRKTPHDEFYRAMH